VMFPDREWVLVEDSLRRLDLLELVGKVERT